MAQSYPASWKNCATCAFWLGKREPDYFCDNVKTDGATARGKCLCRSSGWFHQEKTASSSCQKYEIWPPLH